MHERRQRSTYRLAVPAAAADFEPAEVAAEGGGAEDGVGVAAGLGVGQGPAGGDGVVGGVEGEQRHPHPEERVHARRVPVVRLLRRVPPRRALVRPVELPQVRQLRKLFVVDRRVPLDLRLVVRRELAHRRCGVVSRCFSGFYFLSVSFSEDEGDM